MAWQAECTAAYLRERLDVLYAGCVRDGPAHCLKMTTGRRSNGDGQIKLRWVKDGIAKQAAPRPWAVELHLRGIAIPDGHDASHLCGEGLRGCVDIEHIVVEEHSINLDRRDCHKMTVCPCPCAMVHRVRPVCDHVPACL